MSTASSRPRVRVAPAGVQAWLVRCDRSAQRDLIEHLLAPAAGRTPDLRSLSDALGRPHDELARALFQLNRGRCLWVEEGPQTGDGPAALAGLSVDLEGLLDGRGEGVIADHEGLCLAACGWQGRRADEAAAVAALRPPAPDAGARWWFSSGQVTLAATVPLDRRAPAWVRIARRLLHAFGPLCAEART